MRSEPDRQERRKAGRRSSGEEEADPVEADRHGPCEEAEADADRGDLLLQLERRELDLEPRERAACSATSFTAPPSV